VDAVNALKADAPADFFKAVIGSGESSWKLLQNLHVEGGSNQEMPLALEMSRRMLEGKGAWRIHGGGFAGTILAFVPADMIGDYTARMNSVFGEAAVTPLMIRADGASAVEF
jgi:galactokinase